MLVPSGVGPCAFLSRSFKARKVKCCHNIIVWDDNITNDSLQTLAEHVQVWNQMSSWGMHTGPLNT